MKGKNKIKYREKYRPLDWVYVSMMALFAVIRFAPISFGSSDFNEAINDFAVGGFASTVVAWLTDAANCSKKNKELYNKQKIIFTEYCGAINDLCYFVARRCKNFSNASDEFDIASWLGKLCNENNYTEKLSPAVTMSRAYFHIRAYTRNVKSTLMLLRQQYCMLVESDIVDTDDLRQHISIQIHICDDICDALELNSGNYSNAATVVNDYLIELHDNAVGFFQKKF